MNSLDIIDLVRLFHFTLQFPYPSPTGSEPSKTLRSLVHLRKDTLKLVKYAAILCNIILFFATFKIIELKSWFT